MLMLDFTTVGEYLHLLKEITIVLGRMREQAMYYLAAAVSDFYIPDKKMVSIIYFKFTVNEVRLSTRSSRRKGA